MQARTRGIRRVGPSLATIVAVVTLAACGSSQAGAGSASSDPQTLLRQTFSAHHTVRSGVLDLALTITPAGSSVLTTPISLTLAGPFQSRGNGRLPESAFKITVAALGKRGSLGVTSTGSAGYVSLNGASYRLPAADLSRVESSFAGSAGSGSPGLASLGIDPLHWLTRPVIVGTETVDGTQTTHVRAGVDVAALLGDLNTVLAKETKTISGATGTSPTQISAAARRKIAAAISHPTIDIWTGKRDSTLRKLSLGLDIPVTGRTSTALGGLTSAAITLNVGYSQLNRPQTISTPAHVRSYSEFKLELQGVAQQLQGVLGGSGLGSGR